MFCRNLDKGGGRGDLVLKRNIFVAILAFILILSLVLPAAAAPKVIVDGTTLNFDVSPRIEQGTTLVPLRGIFEALGAIVTWDGASQTVRAIKGNTQIQLQIGSTTGYRNGRAVKLAVPPKVLNGSTLVPLRFVSEALGSDVNWDAATQTIIIFSVVPSFKEPSNVAFQLDTDLIEREFTWYYGGKQWNHTLRIPREVYNYYRSLKRVPTEDYSVYVTDPVDDPFVLSIAEGFKKVADQEKYSSKQTVEFVVSFVQSLKYISDDISTGYDQYARFPLEILVDEGGDCEDSSILLASILHQMNFGVVLILLPGEPGHMAVGVKGDNLPGAYYEYKGARYYYVETTATGWSIGQIPREYRDRQARILPLIPQPVITHEWTVRGTKEGLIELKVTVHNDGSATARNTKVYAVLDAGDNLAYDQRWSDAVDLNPRSKVIYTLYLRPPANVNTRVMVKIVSEGFLLDESASNYFRT